MNRPCKWPSAPSGASGLDRTSDGNLRFRLHHAPLGRILLDDVPVSVSLVREDVREVALPGRVGQVCVSVDDDHGTDGFRIALADVGLEALVEALIEATADGPRTGVAHVADEGGGGGRSGTGAQREARPWGFRAV